MVQADAENTSAALNTKRGEDTGAAAKAELLAELETLQSKKAELAKQKEALEVVDPSRYAAMQEACGHARDSANTWLDNTYSLKDWCQKQFVGREDDVEKHFAENGLTDKVDYLT